MPKYTTSAGVTVECSEETAANVPGLTKVSRTYRKTSEKTTPAFTDKSDDQ